jgi:hypothetical protein
MPYDESWEANDHLSFFFYSIKNSTSHAMQGCTEGLFDTYYKLNKCRRYVNPESSLSDTREEENEGGKSLMDYLNSND